MIRLLRNLLRTFKQPPSRSPVLHTAEELEVFKRDALENRGKHY